MPCTVCHRDIKTVGRGLCRACYSRQYKRGTTDYAPPKVRGVCSIADCGKPHRARGFCSLHYERVLATGNPEETKRPDDWGAIHKHPMFNRWAYAMRRKNEICKEWHDFLTFVIEVGEPPMPLAKLFRADDSKLLGPENFVWKEAYTQRVEGEDEQTFSNRRHRAYRHVRKEEFQEYDLKKHYGMSRKEYLAMADAQDHKCAICKEPETLSIRGKVVKLAVDHCHTSGAVRALLCHHCNKALGGFKDSVERLEGAIAYLKKHHPE